MMFPGTGAAVRLNYSIGRAIKAVYGHSRISWSIVVLAEDSEGRPGGAGGRRCQFSLENDNVTLPMSRSPAP